MDEKPLIEGVGVLYYPPNMNFPDGKSARDYAAEIARAVRQGMTIGFPSTRDENGYFVWDFKIEGSDPGQVQIKRIDADEPTIVE